MENTSNAFCRSHLQNEIRFGCKQYVLFAGENDDLPMLQKAYPSLSIFTLENPDIEWKKALLQQGFHPEQKTFFRLDQLPIETVLLLLSDLSSLCSQGSALCLSCLPEDDDMEWPLLEHGFLVYEHLNEYDQSAVHCLLVVKYSD